MGTHASIARTRMAELRHDLLRRRTEVREVVHQLQKIIRECRKAAEASRALMMKSRSFRKTSASIAGAQPAASDVDAFPTSLTSRERDVLCQLAEGRSNKEVAATLDISVRTVETHRARLMKKLHAHSIGSLVRYAIRNRMIDA